MLAKLHETKYNMFKFLPPIPIRNPLVIINTLHELADLNANEMQYVKPASAGPNKNKTVAIPEKTPLNWVVRMLTSKINIRIMVAQRGI